MSTGLEEVFIWTDWLTLPRSAAISCLLLSVNADTTVLPAQKQPSIRYVSREATRSYISRQRRRGKWP